MVGRRQALNLQLSQISDSVLLGLAFWLSFALRYYLAPLVFDNLPQIPEFKVFLWQIALVAPLTPILLEQQGYYRNPLLKRLPESAKQIAKSLLWVGLMIGACVIFFKWMNGSRVVLIIYAFASTAILLGKEYALKVYLRQQLRDGGSRERVVIAGVPADIRALIGGFAEEELASIEVVAEFDLGEQPIDDLILTLHERSVSRVICAAGHIHFGLVQEAIDACEIEGVEAWLSTGFLKTQIARPDYDAIGGQPMLVFRSTPAHSWSYLLKEAIDRVGAALLLVFTFPLWVLAAIGVKWSSPGAPVFFSQERCGRYGLPFRMYKFRTMVPDAEARQLSLQEDNEMDGPVFKIDNDPRIFAFGRFLRRLSIDELPQLLNVLRGEMSLVGPRPLPVYEIQQISDDAQRRRLSVKPGLTCLWQVSGRNRITSFEEWVELDLEYIDNWSIWLDIKILFRTIPAVFLGQGAS